MKGFFGAMRDAVHEPDECTASEDCHYKITEGAAAYEKHLETVHPEQGKASW